MYNKRLTILPNEVLQDISMMGYFSIAIRNGKNN